MLSVTRGPWLFLDSEDKDSRRLRNVQVQGCYAASCEPAKTTVRVLKGIEALSTLLPAWAELLEAVPSASIFSTWEWLSSWWYAYGASRELITLAMFSADGCLVGIAPLCIETISIGGRWPIRLVRLMGDGSGDSDNLDMTILPGWEAVFVSVFFEYLEEESHNWDAVRLNTFSDESRTPAYMAAELQRRNWTVFSSLAPGVMIDLPDAWEGYLQRLSSNRRWLARKYIRKMERRSDLQLRKCEGGAGLEGDLATFFELHQRRWNATGEPGAFANAERRCFYMTLAPSLASRGWLEFWVLERNGQSIAANFSLRYRDTVYNLQMAFDPAHADEQPGNLVLTSVLRRWIQAGVRKYDFLAGDQQFKQLWGGHMRHYYNLDFAIPRTAGSAYLWMATSMARAKALVWPHFPPRLVSAAHRLKPKLLHLCRL